MDFSTVDLAAEDQEFLDRARRFLAANVTAEILHREHETGDGFIEELHLAMGADGWLEREAKSAKDGGLTLRDGDEWVINGQKIRAGTGRGCGRQNDDATVILTVWSRCDRAQGDVLPDL